MTKTPHAQWMAFVLWLLVVPTSMFMVYTKFPPGEVDGWFMMINFLMLIVVMGMSFQLSSINLSVERWIVFVVFFQYGLAAEMIVMQLAIIILQLTQKSSLPAVYRFSTNSLMFAIVSLASAISFYLAGGRIGEMSPWHFAFAAAVYAICYSLINSAVLYTILKIEKASVDKFKQILSWDFMMTMIVLPLAAAYSLLTDKMGVLSVLLLGAPFLLILLIIRKFAFSGELNKKLSSAVEIGHELTESLRPTEVIQIFTEKIRGVVNYDQAYLMDLRNGEQLALLACSEGGELSEKAQFFRYQPGNLNSLPTDSIQTFTCRKELNNLEGLHFSMAVESVMIAPVVRARRAEGYLVMTSFRKDFFQELDKRMVVLLTGYFETSIMKAYHYEQTLEKSERCGLTKLYNFRYLQRQLRTEMKRLLHKELTCLSAIILDIDHFKSINDTYGHQSGNDILVTFAEILKKHETDGRTLARYGGEEFVLLLPESSKEDAVSLAEQIRQEVETHLFNIIPDLAEDCRSIGVHLTVSLGVSSIPEDTQSEMSLLRNADRALYIGGKQAGRNRVGVYESEFTDPVEA